MNSPTTTGGNLPASPAQRQALDALLRRRLHEFGTKLQAAPDRRKVILEALGVAIRTRLGIHLPDDLVEFLHDRAAQYYRDLDVSGLKIWEAQRFFQTVDGQKDWMRLYGDFALLQLIHLGWQAVKDGAAFDPMAFAETLPSVAPVPAPAPEPLLAPPPAAPDPAPAPETSEAAKQTLRLRWKEITSICGERCGLRVRAALNVVRDVDVMHGTDGAWQVTLDFGSNAFAHSLVAEVNPQDALCAVFADVLGVPVARVVGQTAQPATSAPSTDGNAATPAQSALEIPFCTCSGVATLRSGSLCKVRARISRVRDHADARGKMMALVTIRDDEGEATVVVFPAVYQMCSLQLISGKTVVVTGRCDVRDDQRSIIASDIQLAENI